MTRTPVRRRRSHPLHYLPVVIIVPFLLTQTILPLVRGAAAMGRVEEGLPGPEGYAFSLVDGRSGQPVRYSACKSIHYVINPALAPPSGVEDVHTAFEATGDASGLSFVYDGLTDEAPDFDRADHQPERYGDRWAPIFVGWSEDLHQVETDLPNDGRRRLGIAGSGFRPNDEGEPVYVSGTIVFDATADLRPGYAGRTWGQVMLHEVGHVVGLGHTDHPDSLMNPTLQLKSAAWTPVDVAGLRRLGSSSPCLDQPALP